MTTTTSPVIRLTSQFIADYGRVQDEVRRLKTELQERQTETPARQSVSDEADFALIRDKNAALVQQLADAESQGMAQQLQIASLQNRVEALQAQTASRERQRDEDINKVKHKLLEELLEKQDRIEDLERQLALKSQQADPPGPREEDLKRLKQENYTLRELNRELETNARSLRQQLDECNRRRRRADSGK